LRSRKGAGQLDGIFGNDLRYKSVAA